MLAVEDITGSTATKDEVQKLPSLINAINRLSRDIESSTYYFQQVLNQASAPTGSATALQDGMRDNPREANKEVDLQKVIFSNLKSQYFYLSQKRIFLDRLLTFPPTFAKQEEVHDLETKLQHITEVKKLAKVSVEDTKKEVEELVRVVHGAYEALDLQMSTLLKMSEEAAATQKKLDEMKQVDEDVELRTINELERLIEEEKAQTFLIEASSIEIDAKLESVYAITAEKQSKASILRPQLEKAEKAAREAIRATQLQDKSIEKLSNWYKAVTPLMMRMLGLKSIKHPSTTCMEILCKIADNPEQDVTLQISIGKDEGSSDVEAKFLDLNLSLKEVIRERQYSCGSKGLDELLPLLIYDSLNLAGRYAAKMRELAELEKQYLGQFMYDEMGTIVEGIGKKSEKTWRVLVNKDYPMDDDGGLIVELCGGLDWEFLQQKICALELHMLSKLIPVLIDENLEELFA